MYHAAAAPAARVVHVALVRRSSYSVNFDEPVAPNGLYIHHDQSKGGRIDAGWAQAAMHFQKFYVFWTSLDPVPGEFSFLWRDDNFFLFLSGQWSAAIILILLHE